MHRKALGKGLDALFGGGDTEAVEDIRPVGRRIMTVPLNDIIPNNSPATRIFLRRRYGRA